MRVGVILDSEFINDIRVTNEVNYLMNLGYEIHVLCPSFNNLKEFEIIDRISIHRFRFNKSIKNKLFGFNNILPFYESFWINKVRKFVKKVNPQFLHAHDLYMSKIAYCGGYKKIPVVLDLHENYPAAFITYKWVTTFPYNLLSRPSAWRAKELKYLRYASRIIVLSNTFKELLIDRYDQLRPENLFVYPNVPDLNQMLSFPIRKDIFPRNDMFILFYFGGISERRGIYTCFEAIKILSKEIANIHLLLIGPVDGHEQSTFNRYMNDPTIQKKVTHYKWKDISEFPSYALISDVCLSPIFKNEQHESGVANKIFQYMLFGKPLIVSDCKPQVEIVDSENCGLVFKSDDAKDLSTQILKLYQDRSLALQLGENGRKAIHRKYNLASCGEQLKFLYESLK